MEAIGLPKKYQRLRKWILQITIGYIVLMFYQFAVFVYLQLKFDEYNINFFSICMLFSMFYPEFVHLSSALIWGIILGLVHM